MNRMTEIEARVGELVAKRRELLDEIRRLEEIPDPPVPVAARSSPVTARPRPAARAGRPVGGAADPWGDPWAGHRNKGKEAGEVVRSGRAARRGAGCMASWCPTSAGRWRRA